MVLDEPRCSIIVNFQFYFKPHIYLIYAHFKSIFIHFGVLI